MQIVRIAHLIDPSVYEALRESVLIVCATLFVCSIISLVGRCCGCRCKGKH